ncbi:hypothetical protein Btru_042876 [Bulinus truncatus]|nr:hypothetical protein Btru_042876 [Bulinus truncatus]
MIMMTDQERRNSEPFKSGLLHQQSSRNSLDSARHYSFEDLNLRPSRCLPNAYAHGQQQMPPGNGQAPRERLVLSPDDGYGTDSRSNTTASISSPLSSSLSSLSTFEGSPIGAGGNIPAPFPHQDPNNAGLFSMQRGPIEKGPSVMVMSRSALNKHMSINAKRRDAQADSPEIPSSLEDRLRALTTIEEEDTGLQDRSRGRFGMGTSAGDTLIRLSQSLVSSPRDRRYSRRTVEHSEPGSSPIYENSALNTSGFFRAVPVQFDDQSTRPADSNPRQPLPPRPLRSNSCSPLVNGEGWKDYTTYFQKNTEIPLHNIDPAGRGKFTNANVNIIPDMDINRQIGMGSSNVNKKQVHYNHDVDHVKLMSENGKYISGNPGQLRPRDAEDPHQYQQYQPINRAPHGNNAAGIGLNHRQHRAMSSMPDLRSHDVPLVYQQEHAPSSLSYQPPAYEGPHQEQHYHHLASSQQQYDWYRQDQDPPKQYEPQPQHNVHLQQKPSPSPTYHQQQRPPVPPNHRYVNLQPQYASAIDVSRTESFARESPYSAVEDQASPDFPDVVLRRSRSSASPRTAPPRLDRYSWQPESYSGQQGYSDQDGKLRTVQERSSLDLGSIPQLQRQIRATSELCRQASRRHMFASSADIYKLFSGQKKQPTPASPSLSRNSLSIENNTSSTPKDFINQAPHVQGDYRTSPYQNDVTPEQDVNMPRARPKLRIVMPPSNIAGLTASPGPVRANHQIHVPPEAWVNVTSVTNDSPVDKDTILYQRQNHPTSATGNRTQYQIQPSPDSGIYNDHINRQLALNSDIRTSYQRPGSDLNTEKSLYQRITSPDYNADKSHFQRPFNPELSVDRSLYQRALPGSVYTADKRPSSSDLSLDRSLYHKVAGSDYSLDKSHFQRPGSDLGMDKSLYHKVAGSDYSLDKSHFQRPSSDLGMDKSLYQRVHPGSDYNVDKPHLQRPPSADLGMDRSMYQRPHDDRDPFVDKSQFHRPHAADLGLDKPVFHRQTSGYSSETELQQIEFNAVKRSKKRQGRTTPEENNNQEFVPLNRSLDLNTCTDQTDEQKDEEPVYVNLSRARTFDDLDRSSGSGWLNPQPATASSFPSEVPHQPIAGGGGAVPKSRDTFGLRSGEHLYKDSNLQPTNEGSEQLRLKYSTLSHEATPFHQSSSTELSAYKNAAAKPSAEKPVFPGAAITQKQVINFNKKPVTITSLVPQFAYEDTGNTTQHVNNNMSGAKPKYPLTPHVSVLQDSPVTPSDQSEQLAAPTWPHKTARHAATQGVYNNVAYSGQNSNRSGPDVRSVSSSSNTAFQLSPMAIAHMLDTPFATNVISDEQGDRSLEELVDLKRKMADQQVQQMPQQSVQSSPVQQPQQPQTPTHVQPQMVQQSQQQQQQIHQQIQQQTQQQTRVSNVGTMSIQGMVAPQAATPQPTLTASTNVLRASGTPMPQVQFISQYQPYSFMLQNPNTIAMQISQINYAMQQQQQQQQQQQRAANPANPGSPGGILSPTAATQMPTHISLSNGNNIITGTMQGMLPPGAVGNGSSKSQSTGNKSQAVQGQGQNANTAAIASMVAKPQTVLPSQQTAATPMVLGQIFSSQANTNLANNYVPQQCTTMSPHQAGIRLNQAQVVNSAGQIISQPVQNILTNQAIMQAMASLQMQQQGIPIATATGHQQIISQGQAQMPAIFAGQNFLIRTQAPIQQQPITMTNMQAAAYAAGMKPQQQQQQQQQPQVQAQQTVKANAAGKVILPSVSRAPATAKIQPNMAQPTKVCVPAVPRQPKSRPKAPPKTPTSSTSVSPSTPISRAITSTPTLSSTTVSTPSSTSTAATAVVMSLPPATVAQPPTNRQSPAAVVMAPVTPAVDVTETAQAKLTQNLVQAPNIVKLISEAEVETVKVPATSTASDTLVKDKVKVTIASSSSTLTTSVTTVSSNKSSMSTPVLSTVVSPSAPKPVLETTAACVKMTIDDIVLEEKPKLSDIIKLNPSTIDPAALEAAGLTTVIKESKPITQPVVEKQRAIVKPQILTHYIEGFIIQEGLEPFPVQQSSLLQEFIPPKASLQMVKESEEEGTSYDDEPPILLSQVDAHLSSSPLISHFPQRQDSQDQQKSPVKLLKCEMCQKLGPASTFNNSRRFCSLTCSKRHSVSHTRRVGIYKSRGTARKRKHILGRKNWRVSKGVRLPFSLGSNNNKNDPANNEDSNTAPVGDEMSSSNSAQETSSSAASPSRSQDFEMDMEANIPRSDPGKWTVTEVYEFIQSMPGCREYAEEFRSQEIDGQALLLLKEDHLMTAMNIKLGPALKICSKINSLKADNTPS